MKHAHTYGGFLKCWYPTTMGFPTKNDHFGVFWGYHHLRKHPKGNIDIISSIFFKYIYDKIQNCTSGTLQGSEIWAPWPLATKKQTVWGWNLTPLEGPGYVFLFVLLFHTFPVPFSSLSSTRVMCRNGNLSRFFGCRKVGCPLERNWCPICKLHPGKLTWNPKIKIWLYKWFFYI